MFNKTSVGENVSKNRLSPYRTGELPAINIVNGSDDVEPESIDTSPRELSHDYVLAIHVRVAVADESDNALDALAEEIEPLMHADPFFGEGVCGGKGSMLVGTTFNLSPEGELDIGLMILRYGFEYQTQAPEAPTGMDDFNTAHSTINIANEVHEDEDAEDDIEVQS